MRRFPLRLRAELLRARFVQSLRGSARQNLILRLDPADPGIASSPPSNGNSSGTRTDTDILGLVRESDAPVVWLGGSEPLAHPGIGRLARRIADCGRTVFVETNGFHLRQKIHEFRPVSRLYLTVKFHGLQRSNDLRVGSAGVFKRAIEGIRAAKLSGFLVCGHILVDAETDLKEVAQLKEQVVEMDADGLLVSAAPGAGSGASADTERKLQEARKIVESRGWGTFGRLLERESQEAQARKQNARETDRIFQPSADDQEEGVEVR